MSSGGSPSLDQHFKQVTFELRSECKDLRQSILTGAKVILWEVGVTVVQGQDILFIDSYMENVLRVRRGGQ